MSDRGALPVARAADLDESPQSATPPIAATLPFPPPADRCSRAGPVEIGLAASVVGLAFALRAIAFPDLPAPLHYDEAYYGYSALEILAGRPAIFFPENNGREPFAIYLQALAMAAFGSGPFAIRLPALFLGTLTVALLIPLARAWIAALGQRSIDRRAGAIAAGFFLATVLWHVHFSRFGFRAISLPFWEAIALYCFWRGVNRDVRGWFVLSGLAWAGAGYTYLSARVLPVYLIAIAGLLWIGWAGRRRRTIGHLAGLGLAAGAAIAPLAIYFLRHPDQAIGHSADVAVGSPAALAENAIRLAGMFVWAGDPNWRHNLAGRPVFDPIAGVAAAVGLGVLLYLAVARRSTGRVRTAAIGLVIGGPILLLPSLFSEGAPHFLRGIGALPFLVLLLAVGAGWIWRAAARWPAARAATGAGLAATVALATATAYFGGYAGRVEAYHIFHGHVHDLARTAEALAGDRPIYADATLGRHATFSLAPRDRDVRSFDPAIALVRPAEPALIVVPAVGGVAEADDWAGVPGRPVADRAGIAAWAALDWPGRAASPDPPIRPVRAAPAGAAPSVLTVGESLRLLGRIDAGAEPAAGAPYTATLAWEAIRPATGPAHASLRLIDSAGRVRAQQDGRIGGADLPTDRWRPGDLAITHLGLPIPATLPPGRYTLALQVYDPAAGRVWPAQPAAGEPADTIDLGPTTLARPHPAAGAGFRPAQPLAAPPAGGLRLLGSSTDPAEVWSAGRLTVHSFWSVERPPAGPVHLRIGWQSAGGTPIGDVTPELFDGLYPVAEWRPGDAFEVTADLPPPRAEAAGPSWLRLAWIDAATGASIADWTVPGPMIAGRPRVFDPPARLEATVSAGFGAAGDLIGLDLAGARSAGVEAGGLPVFVATGDRLEIDLAWRGGPGTDRDNRVFVHLAGPDGQPVAQHDGDPAGGAAPTSTWAPGEIVRDRHPIDLAGVPPGDWTLIAGLYDPRTGQRAPADSGGDHARLAVVRWERP